MRKSKVHFYDLHLQLCVPGVACRGKALKSDNQIANVTCISCLRSLSKYYSIRLKSSYTVMSKLKKEDDRLVALDNEVYERLDEIS